MAEELVPIQENEYKELLRQAVAVIENARASVVFHWQLQFVGRSKNKQKKYVTE